MNYLFVVLGHLLLTISKLVRAGNARALVAENLLLILTNLLTYKERKGDIQGSTLLRQISPVAWQHINLHGRYQFNNRPESIDLDAIIEKLAQLPVRENSPA